MRGGPANQSYWGGGGGVGERAGVFPFSSPPLSRYDMTKRNLVFWIGGRVREVVALGIGIKSLGGGY